MREAMDAPAFPTGATMQERPGTRLAPAEFSRAAPLFADLDEHLAAQAVLTGDVPGEVVVDDPRRPRAALAWTGHRFHLAGDPSLARFNSALQRLFADEIFPHAQAAGQTEFEIYPAAPDRDAQIGLILADKHPIRDTRHYYEWDAALTGAAPGAGWRDRLPAGFAVRDVDERLLADRSLGQVDDLIEEVQSEGGTVEDFLSKRFGVCLVHDDEIVGWCVSEFNSGRRCEIGIATDARYRRRGLATLLTAAFIERGQMRGIRRIGWHCWAGNHPSGATARRAGLEKRADYPVYFAWFDPAANLAVNGNVRLRRGEYGAALAWFRRALAANGALTWAFLPAACAAAMAGEPDAALGYAQQAVAAGVEITRIRESEYLRSLHGTASWNALIAG